MGGWTLLIDFGAATTIAGRLEEDTLHLVGSLTQRSGSRVPFRLLLDGSVVVSSTVGRGRLALPAHSYSDLRVEAEGAWSITLH
jgi:hypothetical protein